LPHMPNSQRTLRNRIFMRWPDATDGHSHRQLTLAVSMTSSQIDASMFCKGFLWRGFPAGLMAAAEGGHDRDGPLLAEGRLLSGHEIQQLRERVSGRPADRSKASTSAAAESWVRPPRESRAS